MEPGYWLTDRPDSPKLKEDEINRVLPMAVPSYKDPGIGTLVFFPVLARYVGGRPSIVFWPM